jgi:hypothetical protein
MIDTLSDVLRSVQLVSAVFFAIDASARCGTDAALAGALGQHGMVGVEHVIEYHVVTEGVCWGGARGGPSLRLEAGDVLVLPHGGTEIALHGAAHQRAQIMLARLRELLFAEVMQQHADSLPAQNAGWFAGLRDGAGVPCKSCTSAPPVLLPASEIPPHL